MAQATSYQSPDLIGQEDSTLQNTAESPSTEKKSVLGKLKEKTKTKTSKLRNKLKPGHGGAGDAGAGDVGAGDEDTSSSSSDEDEAPENNAFTGMTQPEYERKLNSGEAEEARDADGIIEHTDLAKPVSIDEFNRRGPNDFPPSHGYATDSALASQFEGLSTEEKPSSQLDVANSTLPSDEAVGAVEPMDSILESAGNPYADDAEVAKDKPDPEGLLTGKPPAVEPAKTWSQWVGEKVGLAKPTSPTGSPTTTPTGAAAGKPITEKIQETVIGAKDAVVGTVSGATGSAQAATQENKQAAATTDPQKQTYTQKLTGVIYGAKDSLVSSTHPGDEDKALSQKVTETVGNLPTTIKSTLGFGGSKSVGSSTTTSPTTTPRSLSSPTEEAEGAPPQSPGIVSRITGSVTSLFGKKPQTESATATSTGHPDTTTTSAGPTSEVGSTETVTPTAVL
ncbi:hypothetical protein R1sor_019958 [Riccia sorocarpa]|uniref:Uncharacterized protein n=1 Tax=Riccia sorocarpa TaxID=122646 RepID=A0ABD3II74_9MARC